MNQKIYEQRREALGACIENNSVVLIFSGRSAQRSADYPYVFSPYRNFYYLTGICKENAALLMAKTKGKIQTALFIEKPDPAIEKWTGKKMTTEEARNLSGIGSVMFMEYLAEYLNSLMLREDIGKLYMNIEHMDSKISGNENYTKSMEIKQRFPYLSLINTQHMLAKMRTLKSEEEIENIKKAVQITEEGLFSMMDALRPNVFEYEIEAEFDYMVRKSGCTGFAFKTIVASGQNGTVLHYEENQSVLKEGELVLIDLGAEYGFYCGDLSRTFPISGKFTKRQKEIYAIVLEAQKKVIESITPGVHLRNLNDIVKAVYLERLKQIGLIEKEEDIAQYYYHGVSHHLGLDTHDICDYDAALKPGMVITVEPGLYIEAEGIGIRIEDDVLVTEEGCEVLSKNILKEIDEIEAYMAKRK